MRALRLLPVLLALTFAAPLAARAQEDTLGVVRLEGRRVEPVGGIRIGFPQKLSAYVGATLVTGRYDGGHSGWTVTVEPGLGGGLAGAGRTTSGGPLAMVRTQLAVLRTWGDPWLVGPDATYVGLDTRITVLMGGVSLGGFVRIP